MNRIENCVVPWDFSNHSKAALMYARQRFPGESIKVICVLEPPNPYEPGFNWGPEVQEEATQHCYDEFFRSTELTDQSSIKFQVKFGEPSEEICRFADEVSADFIVISTHGRTGLKKLMLGSVAQKVVASTNHPVILLPAKWFDQHDPAGTNSTAEMLEAKS